MRINVLLLLFFTFLTFGRVSAQSIQHTYRFYQKLLVDEPECGPELIQAQAPGNCGVATTPGKYIEETLPCGARRFVYQNSLDWGLAYPNQEGAIGTTYTIQMYVKVVDWGRRWARIIDFSNGTLDEGVYFKDAAGSQERCLHFYPKGAVGACPSFNKSTYYLLTFTRNGQTGVVDVYVDDKLFASYNDSDGRYVGKPGVPIYIFRDDSEVACESGAANFAYLSFNNRYTSKEEVEDRFRDVCFVANVNTYAEFSISPNPSCGYPKNIEVKYTGPIAAPGNGYTFEWDWDGARVISGSGMGPYVVSWDTGGAKNVALTVRSNGCGNPLYNRKQAIIDSVDVNATIVAGSCETGENGTVTLSGSQGPRPYLYSLDSVSFVPDSVYQLAVGAHKVWVKDGYGCTTGKTIDVKFESDIQVSTLADTTICPGETVTLATNGNGDRYAWLPAAGLDNAASKDPLAAPESTATYIVTAYKGFCTQTDTVHISVAPKVEVRLTPDSQVDYNVPFRLYATSPQVGNLSDASFLWSPATGLNNPNTASPVATLQDDQTYTVEVTSGLGCKGVGNVNLSIRYREGITIPSAFTPDGDGINEVLMPVLSHIQSVSCFKIFNRWGQVVYFTEQMNAGWDGRFKGAAPVAGTYVWEVEGMSEKGNKIHRRGTVMLIK